MTDGQIIVSGLMKYYKDVRAVDDLSFVVRPGHVTGFLGPNGAGKTTTLRMVLGLVRPTGGTATISGQPYVELQHPLRMVGAVLEASGAHTGRTGRNHLRVTCATAGLPLRRADEVLDMVGLTPAANRKVKGYSLGMKQRLGIAHAMLGDPGVLILDEPANGLDPEGISWIRRLLRDLAGEGRTILISSHLLSEVEALAEEVVILARGKLVAQGTVDAIHSRLKGPQIRVRTEEVTELTAALTRSGGRVSTDGGTTLLVTGLDSAAIGAAALRAGVELQELVVESPDLEQAFLELTHGMADIR